VALSVAGVAVVTERSTRRTLQAEMQMRLVLEARNLALLSTDALLAEYPELTLYPAVREMLDRQKHLTMAVVLDHAGRVQGHTDLRLLGQPDPALEQLTPLPDRGSLRGDEALLGNPQTLAIRAPVRHQNGQLLGSVVVGQQRDHVSSVLAATRRQLLWLAAALAVIGGLTAVGLMSRLLRPVDVLRRGLERIGAGDLDTPINLSDRTELGMLAGTMNTMASQLKTSRAESQAKEEEIVRTQHDLIEALCVVVEGRSQETASHTVRVGQTSAMLAHLAGLGTEQVELLRQAAPMHDLGKIAIPDAILNKPGKLTDEEYRLMQTHASVGHRILDQSDRALLKAAAIVAHDHHERWDGRGYPRGLRGESIHVFGRIVSICDVFDALTSDRVYRPAMPMSKALAIMKEGRGTQFDPRLLDLFLDAVMQSQALLADFDDGGAVEELLDALPVGHS
ncbi:MAG: HD domain-containing protein, partial [Candidatus Latescibacteria bacterium]|nr:HD domain-containing protein [Candidatus Latescibacterota bacterium]